MRSVSLFVSLLLLSTAASFAQSKIETIAGTGKAGFPDETALGLDAKLNNPFGVIVAPDGDIVFCDTGNHLIRKISRKSGEIETLVGTGEPGYTGDGEAPDLAQLNEPYEVRFHPGGDLYWVEMKNHIVRKLDARTNIVSTVAGTGEAGFSGDGGSAVEAGMNRPHSIQFLPDGKTLLICDIGNHRIRALDLGSGKISTWCGTGEAQKTKDGAEVSPLTPLKGPRALDLSPNGDLWLALREGNQVFRIDLKSGTLHHVAGRGAKGFDAVETVAKKAKLSGPKGIAISPDGNQVYLADTESHTVRVIDLTGPEPMVRVVAGDGTKGDGPDSPDPSSCRMARLHGVGTDPVTGDLYIGDSESNKVRRITGLPGGHFHKRLNDYETDEFKIDGRACRIARPDNVAEGRPWIWRARFFGAFPAADEALLAKGWHVAWIDVGHLFGGPEAMDAFDTFYTSARERYQLAGKPVMEGFSRGGLGAMNWAIRHPEKVAGLYLDAPVLDIHSWPGELSPALWGKALNAYGLEEGTAEDWKGPLKGVGRLIEAKLPLLLIAGGDDNIVPFARNGARLEKFYREMGGDITTIIKAGAGHHPHSLHEASRIVAWAERVTAP
ncbi:MAG: beta-propeller fold lactonase family protein [Verrucomicrobiales bacterium]|nr:beta-propeller fold lactonase family protein [Verrucomicrobiales bacterium]